MFNQCHLPSLLDGAFEKEEMWASAGYLAGWQDEPRTETSDNGKTPEAKMWLNPAETQKSLFLLGLLPLIQYAELILLLKSHEKFSALPES